MNFKTQSFQLFLKIFMRECVCLICFFLVSQGFPLFNFLNRTIFVCGTNSKTSGLLMLQRARQVHSSSIIEGKSFSGKSQYFSIFKSFFVFMLDASFDFFSLTFFCSNIVAFQKTMHQHTATDHPSHMTQRICFFLFLKTIFKKTITTQCFTFSFILFKGLVTV
jgi:hypothetical protein